MRERLVSLVLALAALATFYALWLQPGSGFSNEDAVRPTTTERHGNGYAALFEWLNRSGVRARSFRERYTALADLDPPRGNLLVLTLPAVEVFRHEEYGALDQWVRKGNTLLIVAALVDQPGWGARRASGAVAEIESLTGLEFESAESRAQRLDDTPLSQRVREQDEREAGQETDKEVGDGGTEDSNDEDDALPEDNALDEPESIELTTTGPHALLRDVSKLHLDTDYGDDGRGGRDWSLRIPYDSFVLTLARTAQGEGALFEQRLGAGHILVSAGGSLFTNRALGEADNARLFGNIIQARMRPEGMVLFDDLRQGLSASYNPARFYRDARLYKTLFIMVALWLAWVVGSTRLRAPVLVEHAPSEADLVRHTGGLIARTVAPHHTARRLFDGFFANVARAVRGATGTVEPERGELWQWLERHAAILPQELDQLKSWYAEAHAERKVPLVPLQNLLDTLGKRLNT
ncbi:MAG TPA: DUF4350 domain-containing protein [Steroidobacteraceae bacterium]|nr:DUF4350 domain-containing protein [Steroidobacteraceae bacterium]